MKAIALISGGLDSVLAARLIKDLGIEVTGVYFKIPFTFEPKKQDRPTIEDSAQAAGVPLTIIDLGQEYLEIVKKPRHGYGKNINPCIDCKILMLKKAKGLMLETGASFLITGEVLGQRPMSQNRRSLDNIEKEAQVEGILLRPLCAKLMPESLPEKQGWVDRNKLLDLNGRTRRPQIDLAQSLGILEYQEPAGGCLLTVPDFANRIKDLLKHKDLSLENIELLKAGRYFRLAEDAKLVMARDERECARLIGRVSLGDHLFYPDAITAGPTAVLRGKVNEDMIRLSASITAFYFDLNGKTSADVVYRIIPSAEEKTITVSPVAKEELNKYRI